MRILGIDTATRFFCLAILDKNNIYSYKVELFKKQAELVSDTIIRVTEALNLRLENIDYFACGLGPGSFTGIRIGLSTIKALGFALNKSIIGFSTLDILAEAVDKEGYIIPVMDARRDMVYTAIYKRNKDKLIRKTGYKLIDRKEFYKLVPKNAYIFGDAIEVYGEEFRNNLFDVHILDSDFWYPQSHIIITLAKKNLNKKKLFTSFTLKPIYLYPKECQIRK